jgi:hypothetical protein
MAQIIAVLLLGLFGGFFAGLGAENGSHLDSEEHKLWSEAMEGLESCEIELPRSQSCKVYFVVQVATQGKEL